MPPLSQRLKNLATRRLARRPVSLRFDSPVISFTFDDVLADATRIGLDILDESGIRATWYIAPGLIGAGDGPCGLYASRDDIRRLIDAGGQDIGGHLYSHRSATELSNDELRDEHRRCCDWLGEHADTPSPAHFAYPKGAASPRVKRILGDSYQSLRGIRPGVINNQTDAALLSGTALYGDAADLNTLESWFTQLESSGGWMILYTHDIRDNPSTWGATPALLRAAVHRAQAIGAKILSVEQAWQTGLSASQAAA